MLCIELCTMFEFPLNKLAYTRNSRKLRKLSGNPELVLESKFLFDDFDQKADKSSFSTFNLLNSSISNLAKFLFEKKCGYLTYFI